MINFSWLLDISEAKWSSMIDAKNVWYSLVCYACKFLECEAIYGQSLANKKWVNYYLTSYQLIKESECHVNNMFKRPSQVQKKLLVMVWRNRNGQENSHLIFSDLNISVNTLKNKTKYVILIEDVKTTSPRYTLLRYPSLI